MSCRQHAVSVRVIGCGDRKTLAGNLVDFSSWQECQLASASQGSIPIHLYSALTSHALVPRASKVRPSFMTARFRTSSFRLGWSDLRLRSKWVVKTLSRERQRMSRAGTVECMTRRIQPDWRIFAAQSSQSTGHSKHVDYVASFDSQTAATQRSGLLRRTAFPGRKLPDWQSDGDHLHGKKFGKSEFRMFPREKTVMT